MRLDRQLAGPTPAAWPAPLDWPPTVDGLKPVLVRVALALQRVYRSLFPASAAPGTSSSTADDSTDTETDLPDVSDGDVAMVLPSLAARAELAAASSSAAASASSVLGDGGHQGGSTPSLHGTSASLGSAAAAPALETKENASTSTLSRFGGLRNARQGCYANAVMQQLAVAKGLRKFIAQIE